MRQTHKQETLVSGANAGASYDSTPHQLAGVLQFSLHVVFSSATLNGSLKMQGSNDPNAYLSPGSSDWVDINYSTQTITSGASHLWNVTAASYNVFRFVWTRTSGTGTLSAYLVSKYDL